MDDESLFFSLSKQDRQLIFKATDRQTLLEWTRCLDQQINNCLRKLNVSGLKPSGIISNNEFKRVAETGDILLFQSKTIASQLQRVVTSSKFDHVALVVRLSQDRLVIFESLRETGVATCDWDRFITKKWNEMYNLIVYRKLKTVRDENFALVIQDFMRQTLGKPFKLNPVKLLRKVNYHDSAQIIKETKSFFCSELVATAYKRLGLLEQARAAS